ncbi:BON domain-containing protein [Cupriavidus sp. 2TAF22]|uniref:BON domain-containing protein n=1 Tax=unclassified Cupriavidus TaxID=2640874 RepID=UPI003F906C5A
MGTWTDEYGRQRYAPGGADAPGNDDGARATRRAQRHAWYSGDRNDDSWRLGEDEIARYESRYPQARFRRPASAIAGMGGGERQPWGQGRWDRGRDEALVSPASRRPDGDGYASTQGTAAPDGAPGGRGYVSGYASGYADGYRAAQRARATPGVATAGPGAGMAGPDEYQGAGYERSGYERGRRMGPKGYRRSDESLREEVCERLACDHTLDVSEVTVSVSGGMVTLEGTVTQRHIKYEIEEVADDVYGVTEVINQIRVRPYGVLASE